MTGARAKPLLILAALAAAVWILAVWAPGIASGSDPIADDTTTSIATVTVQSPTPPPIVLGYAGHSARYWRDAYLAERARATSLHRVLLHRATVAEALNLACAVYGHCSTLWRRARCESQLRSLAANASSSARGLFQFLTRGRVRRYGDYVLVSGGTWATTPFWRFDVSSPYANALAAGWMISVGRGGEWVCR